MGGMTCSDVSQSGDAKRPKAIVLTEPGNTSSAGSGKNDTVKLGAVPVWRDHWIADRLVNGNEPRILAGSGTHDLISRRIFSRTAVALCVVKTLAAAIR